MCAKQQFRQHFSLIFLLRIATTVLRAVPGLRHFLPCVFGGFDLFFARACARNPSFGNILLLKLLDIRAHVSARSVSDSCCSLFLSRHFSQPGLVGFGFLPRACARNPSFGNILSSRFFHIRAHGSARSIADSFFCFVYLVFLSQPGLVGFGFLSRACAQNGSLGTSYSRISFPFVFQEPTLSRESMPKP